MSLLKRFSLVHETTVITFLCVKCPANSQHQRCRSFMTKWFSHYVNTTRGGTCTTITTIGITRAFMGGENRGQESRKLFPFFFQTRPSRDGEIPVVNTHRIGRQLSPLQPHRDIQRSPKQPVVPGSDIDQRLITLWPDRDHVRTRKLVRNDSMVDRAARGRYSAVLLSSVCSGEPFFILSDAV